MKRLGATQLLPTALIVSLLASGCTTNMAGGAADGAMKGAVSASFLGAVTDLIVDGRVDTYRLQRNLVGGAVAGGAAGAAMGHQKDLAETQQKQAQAARAERGEQADLAREIGHRNVDALIDLLNYRHEKAFSKALKTSKSGSLKQREAGLVIQALVDADRGNEAGAREAVEAFVELNEDTDDVTEAMAGLKELQAGLQDERKIKGIRNPR